MIKSHFLYKIIELKTVVAWNPSGVLCHMEGYVSMKNEGTVSQNRAIKPLVDVINNSQLARHK